MTWLKERFFVLARLIGIIVLALIGVVWIISWHALRGVMILSGQMTKVHFPTRLVTANETGRSNMVISAASEFCIALKSKSASAWHPELRNNKRYDGKITHITIADDRRRYVYLLQDGSRLMVSHQKVDGRIVVSAKIIHENSKGES